MGIQDFFIELFRDHIMTVVLFVLIVADMVLYYAHPRFFAGIGIPVQWKRVGDTSFADMSQVRAKLETAAERYAFYSDETSVWFRDRYRATGWGRGFGSQAMGKGLIVREGGDFRCRFCLTFTIALIPFLWVDFFLLGTWFERLSLPGLIFLGVYTIFTGVMAFVKIKDFKKIMAALGPDDQAAAPPPEMK